MSKTKTPGNASPKSSKLIDQLTAERRRIDFDSYDISVQQLLSMVTTDQIDVAPTYQRRFRWNDERQSQLIESVFLGIPVPNLFMAANKDGTWEVVDGVQRLSTIVHFAGDDAARKALGLDGSLVIGKLEKLPAMNGLTFAALPQSVQTQFALRPLKVTTLSDKSDLKVRFDLFERLNTGGVSLTAQEIRGCIYRGQFNDFLEEMSKDANFRKVVLLRDSNEADGTREEYVLRFFAFLHRYQEFDHSVIGFLNDYMAGAGKSFNYAVDANIFKKTFAQLAKIFPNGISRATKVTPVNLFEAVAVGAAIVLEKHAALSTKDTAKWVISAELKALTTGATNSKQAVRERIEFAINKFQVG